MSWFRVEGKAPSGVKHAPLSDRAFRLWVTAGCWSAEHRTDGMIQRGIPETLTRAPQGRALKSTIDELVAARLWEVTEEGWLIHDFGDWNITSEEYARKQEAGRQGGRASGSKRQARAQALASPNTKHVLEQTESTSSSGPQAESDTDTDPVGEVVAKDLSGCGAPTTSDHDDGPSRGGDDEGRETVCPLNLAEKLPPGMLQELADGHRVPLAAIERALSEFIAYWTIGGGAGRRRRNWPRQFRTRCQELAKRGDLGAEAREPPTGTRRTQRRHASTDEEIEAYIASTHRESA